MISLSCVAHFLWEWDDLCRRGRVPLDASHLVHGHDERPHRTELRDPAYARAVLRQTHALSQQQVEWFVGEQRQAATE
jgi:hypothetical protein